MLEWMDERNGLERKKLEMGRDGGLKCVVFRGDGTVRLCFTPVVIHSVRVSFDAYKRLPGGVGRYSEDFLSFFFKKRE